MSPQDYTGEQCNVTMIDGTKRMYPLSCVEVQSTFYTGRVTAAVMQNPVSDFVIGNIPGVKNSCSTDVSTQTSAAAVTRGAARATRKVVPLQVTTATDLDDSEDVIAEQARDPTLSHARAQALTGDVKEHKGVETGYVKLRNRIYRRTVYPDDENAISSSCLKSTDELCSHLVITRH